MKSARQSFHLASLLLIVGLQFALTAEAKPPALRPYQSTQEALALEVGKPVERELAGGEKHAYPISLVEGQYIKLEVRSKGIDVGLDLQLPGGKVIQWFQPFGGQQELSVAWVSQSAGIYRPIVYAAAKAPPGQYEIRLIELRPATEKDRALQEARELFDEYGRLNRVAKFVEARAPLMRALEIRERILGADDLLVAETLQFLASNYSVTGDYVSGEPLYLRALTIFEKKLGPDNPRVARSLAALGGLYLQKGDELKAEEVDRRALAIYDRTHLTENPAVGSILATLAGFYYARGDYENAEKYYERSRTVWEKLLGPDHFHLAPSYTHLGRVAYDAGNYSKAEAMFQRALTLAENGLGADHTSVTDYRDDLAMVYCTTGNYEKGEAMYRQSLAVHQQKAAMGRPAAQEVLLGLARCYAAQGNMSEAVNLESQASELEERYVALNLAVGSEREKLAFLANLNSHLSRNISLSVQLAPNDPTARDLAALSILRRKGRVQDAISSSLDSLRSRFNAEDQKLLDSLNQTTAELARVVLGPPQEKATTERQERIAVLEKQKENLEEEVGRRSAGFYQQTAPVTLTAVRTVIPTDAALVEYAVYRSFDPKAPENAKAFGESKYVVYVIRNQSAVQCLTLGTEKEIDDLVAQLREALRDPQRKDAEQLARALDQKVMRPVRSLVGDARQLFVSPDGELNLVPFAALVDEQGRYLIQRYSFTYLTSGRDLLRMQATRESKSNVLVVANPSFGERLPAKTANANAGTGPEAHSSRRRSVTSAASLVDAYFAPLDATEVEAQSIKALFPEANVLTGADATVSAIKQVTAPRILHLATHGFFLSEPPAVAGGSRDSTTTRGTIATARTENPLLRSGLAFAGANLRSGASGDGILTALEASGLNLWGTKLVVLSACDTGVGQVRNGEGVYGLRRAFVLAGSESLVMSLWSISDYTTRQLMTTYYKNLKQGLGRGEALRQVQLDMLKRNPKLHPFYWANFIQAGDWTSLNNRR